MVLIEVASDAVLGAVSLPRDANLHGKLLCKPSGLSFVEITLIIQGYHSRQVDSITWLFVRLFLSK